MRLLSMAEWLAWEGEQRACELPPRESYHFVVRGESGAKPPEAKALGALTHEASPLLEAAASSQTEFPLNDPRKGQLEFPFSDPRLGDGGLINIRKEIAI